MIYLSICIPTFKRVEITKNTIESIYSDLTGVDLDEFEVIVSDNDPEGASGVFQELFPYPNFHYYLTKCDGFLNSFFVLGYGKGAYLKLHNNYTKLKAGSLKYLIDEIKKYDTHKPCLFFTNGHRHIKLKKEYHVLDSYMRDLSYFSSWSSGFGIWKKDFETIKDKIVVDKMFPQTSMFTKILNKEMFILYDNIIFEDQKVPKKGGYNPYKVFGVDYLGLIKPLKEKNMISSETYEKIKKDLLYEYLSSRFFKTVIMRMDNFAYDDIKMIIQINYSTTEYYKMLLYSPFTPIKYILDKIF